MHKITMTFNDEDWGEYQKSKNLARTHDEYQPCLVQRFNDGSSYFLYPEDVTEE